MLERVHKFFACPENRVGVLESHPACFGQHQLAILPDKQRVSQGFFQMAKLDTESRLRNVHFARCLGKAAFVSDGPKIPQVMIVQKHTLFPIYQIERFYIKHLLE